MTAAAVGPVAGSGVTEGILDALHWCRLGRVRPQDDNDFHRAKALGLLAQDNIWRTTIAGEVVLAKARPDAYGKRPMAVECPHCQAEPYEPCRDFRPRHRYQLTHSKRDRRGAAP